MLSNRFGFRRHSKSRQRRRRERFVPRLQALEERWLLSTIAVTTTADLLNINLSETIDQVNANPPTAGNPPQPVISLRDAIIAANNSGGGVIDCTMIGSGIQEINLTSPLPDITADGVTINASPATEEVVLNGSGAGNATGLSLLGNNCTIDGLTIVRFGSAGVLIEGTGNAVNNCYIGIDPAGHPGLGDGTGIYVYSAVAASLTSNDIENNSGDGVQVFYSEGITIDGNITENNADDGIRVEGQMPNSGQMTITTINSNQIDFNAGNGIHLQDSSYNKVGTDGKNYIGNDTTTMSAEPNGGDGVLIESSNPGLSTNNSISRNYIGGNNGNGVALTGPGTSSNSVVDNLIGYGFSPGTDFGSDSIRTLPNNLDGVLVSGGAHDNSIGGAGLFLNDDSHNGAGNIIGPNLGDGVMLTDAGTTGNMVQGNLIGTNFTGTSAIYGLTSSTANGLYGVAVANGANNNLIGGLGGVQTSSGYGNLISGNSFGGVDLSGAGTTANQVEGNFIGTDVSGAAKVGNLANGVTIQNGASGNTIDLGNVISGNSGNGIEIAGVGTSNNLVQGNSIGTNDAGTGALPNANDGVLLVLVGSGGNHIGGSIPGSGNLISGNGKNGIHAVGLASFGNLIQGNEIGTDTTGELAIPNHLNGVLINNTSGYMIGGTSVAAGNLISGNNQDGIQITGSLSAGIFVLNNHIGTDVHTIVAVANQGNGVDILNQARSNFIGLGASGNVISGNAGDGVRISQRASGNSVRGNRIGTDISGTLYVPNGGNGVNIINASGNFVGGTSAAAGNLISGNLVDGVQISQGASSNVLLGNSIGADVTGALPLRNKRDGVEILSEASNNLIGYVTNGGTVIGNLISGNAIGGVVISSAYQNIVQGNRIGTTQSGLSGLGNLGDGVVVMNGASLNQIGVSGFVSASGAPNIISGNGLDGVAFFGAGTTYNALTGNRIGTDGTGQAPLGNVGHGVFLLLGAHDNIIGGLTTGTPNTIAFNGQAGVAVGLNPLDVATVHNPILSNSIFANGGLGIDLANNGVTLNTPGGPHVGPNDFQNFPVITAATVANATTSIDLTLDSIPTASFIIQVFANAAPDTSGYGQGRTLVATAFLAAGQSGTVVTVPQDLTGQYLTATATALGSFIDTSEFGQDFLVPPTMMMLAIPGHTGAAAVSGVAANPTQTSETPLPTIVSPAGFAGAPEGASSNRLSAAGLVSSGQFRGQQRGSAAATDVLDRLFAEF
ncbi:MAG TPA: right-handed parallel beta-helix repeat-containing protein [Gemmataceae bacterium]|jgi:parallel beta-helix repeat protein|nr:right-handed parallel beta-helix repeat-containing protein [Gemmataceae bacterium]